MPTQFIGPDGLPRTYTDPSECVNGYDGYGVACTDWSPITNDPAATAAAINSLYAPSPKTAAPAPSVGVSSMTVIAGVGVLLVVVSLMGGRR